MKQSHIMTPFFNWMWLESFMFIHERVNNRKEVWEGK
ncbi:hypothetical protein QFZ31_004376 [Neobacillus niacini]|nr:hypothetical protein [Neobacillus niacini]